MEVNTQYKPHYRILMIGTGATGSQLLPFLAQLLNNFNKSHPLTLMDGDIFETKNLKNQKCTINDISSSKAKVLAERYQLVYQDLDISYVDEYALDKERIINLLKIDINAIPILIGCVDNNASRKLFNEVFNSNEIKDLIYIDSGNGTIDRNGQIVVGYKSSCSRQDLSGDTNVYRVTRSSYKILKPVCDVFPSILKDDDTLDKLTSCTQVVDEHPQNIATNVMAASTLFSILNEILTFNRINTHMAYFDAEHSTIESIPPRINSVEECYTDRFLME